MMEPSILGADLLGQLSAVLEQIVHQEVVFLDHKERTPESRCIITGVVGPDGDIVLAFGPPATLGGSSASSTRSTGGHAGPRWWT
jgi:hypothetical protein